MLSARYRHLFSPILEKIGARIPFHPDVLTLLSPFVALYGAYLLAFGNPAGALVGGIAALLDALDGAIARARGLASKLGAYLDAIVDRIVEGIILLGIGMGWPDAWPAVLLVLLFSLLISYAKARAAMETKVDNINWPDIFERGERLILLCVGFPLVAWLAPHLVVGYLYLLAFLFGLGFVQRVKRAMERIA